MVEPNRMRTSAFEAALIRMHTYPKGVPYGDWGYGPMAMSHGEVDKDEQEWQIQYGAPAVHFALIYGCSYQLARKELGDILNLTHLAYKMALHRSPANLARQLEVCMDYHNMLRSVR